MLLATPRLPKALFLSAFTKNKCCWGWVSTCTDYLVGSIHIKAAKILSFPGESFIHLSLGRKSPRNKPLIKIILELFNHFAFSFFEGQRCSELKLQVTRSPLYWLVSSKQVEIGSWVDKCREASWHLRCLCHTAVHMEPIRQSIQSNLQYIQAQIQLKRAERDLHA